MVAPTVSAERTVTLNLWQNIGDGSDRILLELWQETLLDDLRDVVFWSGPMSMVDFFKLADNNPFFVLTLKGELCGYLWLTNVITDQSVEISLCLFKRFHSRGIGKEAISTMVDALFKEKVQVITAKGQTSNKTAIGLMTSVGFDVVGHVPVVCGGITIVAITQHGWRLYNGG